MRLLAVSAICFVFAVTAPAASAAEPLVIGDLQGEDCSHLDEQTQEEVVGYWRRQPPFVGYRKGERLLAGGNGTCVFGFPNSDDKHALVLVNGAKTAVFFIAERGNTKAFASRDGSVNVTLSITGEESTCEPDGDKCCGDYTYVTVTIHKGNRKASVRAVTYVGG